MDLRFNPSGVTTNQPVFFKLVLNLVVETGGFFKLIALGQHEFDTYRPGQLDVAEKSGFSGAASVNHT